jgi:hypothetical protein
LVTYLGPGDVVIIDVFRNGSPYGGHVLVVNDTSDVTSGTINLVSQNSGYETNSEPVVPGYISGGLVTIGGGNKEWTYTTVGVVHAPVPTSPPPGSVAVANLPFPVAYTTVAAVGIEDVWVAGKGRKPTRVASMSFSTPSWSGNGRYLVTLVNPDRSAWVWRYDDVTGAIRTWRCDGCDQAAVVGDEIVAVDSKQQLLRFPLSGGNAERPLAITGMPSWSRSRLTMGAVPDAIGGTDSAALLTWPLEAGASNLWGTFVLVGLNGRYLRTVVGPGKWKGGVSIADADYGGIAMAPDTRSALVNEFGEISACQSGGNLAWLSLDGARNVSYPNPQGPKGTSTAPLSLAVDSTGNSWAVFTATKWGATKSGGTTCSATPPRLYEWTRRGWEIQSTNVLGVAFGPRNRMLVIQGHPPSGAAQWSGTLVVKEPGHQITVASNVLGVTVPRQ